jgi:HAD superfamily hydrolase (TIGR01457 family)
MTANLAARYDAFLFDLDGVLYRGHESIPGAAEAVERLRGLGKRVAFVTNNSSRTPEVVAEALNAVGVQAHTAEVETSALATADLLVARGVTDAFVIGEEGVREALRGVGIAIVAADAVISEAVVVGWDRQADYAKLRTACLLVERGAWLVATNADASYPAPDGRWPGAGALLAAIETTTEIRAEVVGKPHPPILRSALDRAGGGRPLMIGDRIETDIAGAAGLGWDSLLVLTGITRREDLVGSPIEPTFVGDDLSTLFDERPDEP